ncbi:MAG TPA: rod shape-determining protein MreC [Pyrinomonadaceae bacterium]|nr:rod shape-determining protein MreC [Pyrinomonadaceae bacterium]
MVRSTQKEIRQRAPVWLLVLLAVNFGLMTWDARDAETRQRVIRVWAQAAAAPVQRAVSGAGGAGVDLFEHLGNLRGAEEENTRLRERLAAADNELSQMRQAAEENERLKGLLQFAEDVRYETVPARVIARDPSVWFNSLILNRGTTSGVDLDMAVATPEGIVGRVVAVGPLTSQVMLITDERAAAGAVVGQLGASEAVGSVRGYGRNGLLEMRYVSGLAQVEVGDQVATTGQDRIYPPGLPVGQVVELTPGSATTPHTIRVKPGARLDSLQEVLVLRYRAPQRTPPERTLPNVERRGQ